MDDIIKQARDAFDECMEAESHNHDSFKDDVRFARLGEQWPEAIKKQRESEGRPVLTINKLAPIIRQVVNDSRQNKPAIKVHPVDDDADPETAEVISGLIRNIETTSDADIAYDTAIESAVGGGFGYWKVNIEHTRDGTFEQDICIRRVANPLTVLGDPRSTAADSSDWNVAFEVETFKKTAFERRFPGAKQTDWNGADWMRIKAPWVDGDDIQVAAYWTRDEIERKIVGLSDGSVLPLDEYEKNKDQYDEMGVTIIIDPRPIPSWKVTQRLMSGCEELKKVEWVGKYIPIIPVYGDEVNLEGKRYFRSLIADAKDPARMMNYWRTTATEVVALAPRVPFIGRKGAFESDAAKWATANTVSHSHIEYDGGEMPMRQGMTGVPQGMIQEALNAADDIKAVTGIYDASLGARSNETSGKAIMARQREGDVSTFHFIDNLARSIRHTGRVVIDLIPKVYNTERVIRVMGEDNTAEAKKVNAPYEVKPAKMDEGGNEDQAAIMALHDLTVGKYDVTVSAGPSFTTRREEAATQMMELIRSFPDAAPVIGDLVAKNLDWPGADEVAKRLKMMLPPQLQEKDEDAPDPEKQMMQQHMQMMQQALDAAQGKIAELSQQRNVDADKVEIDRYNAETNRLKVTAPAMGSNEIQAIVMQTLQDLLAQELPQAEGPDLGQPAYPDPAGMAA